MGRSPCCSKDEDLNRGAWTAMEDRVLKEYITAHGEGKWRNLPKRAGLKRCGKSCRLRWLNYLRPDIKRGNITRDEEELIIRLHKLLGNRWSLIAGRLPGRTDNEIKNYWNTTIGKKVQGDSFCEGNRTPPNQTKEKPKPTLQRSKSQKSQSPKANTTPSCTTKVVRTKASRCTKVVIPEKIDGQIGYTTDHVVNNAPSGSVDETDQANDPTVGINEPLSQIFFLDDESSSCEFLVDFKMDENFLSDFLNVDFSQLYNSRNEEDTKAASNSIEEDHKLQGTGFRSSVPSMVDSEIDWLVDNAAN